MEVSMPGKRLDICDFYFKVMDEEYPNYSSTKKILPKLH